MRIGPAIGVGVGVVGLGVGAAALIASKSAKPSEEGAQAAPRALASYHDPFDPYGSTRSTGGVIHHDTPFGHHDDPVVHHDTPFGHHDDVIHNPLDDIFGYPSTGHAESHYGYPSYDYPSYGYPSTGHHDDVIHHDTPFGHHDDIVHHDTGYGSSYGGHGYDHW